MPGAVPSRRRSTAASRWSPCGSTLHCSAEPDAELLEDLIAAAVNAGLVKAREAAAQSLSSLTGGLPMGLFPNLGGGPAPGGEGGR